MVIPIKRTYSRVCFSRILELFSALATEAFSVALRQFFVRRGKFQQLYSDNATNFVGSNRELEEIYALFNTRTHRDKVKAALAE